MSLLAEHVPDPRRRADRRLGRRPAARAVRGRRRRRLVGARSWRTGSARYHGILIRSATQLTAELIGRADNLQVIGRAGIGVDNVDVEAATKRGIIVANAPQSNIVAAAEHTIALMLALARNIPQAHASLTAGPLGAVAVRRRGGVREDAGRAGLRPHRPARRRPRARVRDADRRLRPVRERGALPRARRRAGRGARRPLRARPTSSRVHLPKTPETRGWLDAEAFAAMRDGVRVINCARGELVDDAALKAALDSGKVAGRGAGRVPERADHRLPAVRRLSERGRDAASGRVDDRGAGPRGRADGRAGGGGADRRGGLHRGEHPRDQRGGHGRARPVPPAHRAPRPARDGAGRGLGRRPRRGRVLRPRSPSATRACSRSPCSRACSPATARRTSTSSTRRRWPRSAGIARVRAQGVRRARLHRPRADHDRLRRRALPRGRHDARPPGPPAPARGVGPALQPPARRGRPPRAVPLLRPARA